MCEYEAARAVRDSYLSKALANDKDFVEHDTVEEWAEFIHDEINNEELFGIVNIVLFSLEGFVCIIMGNMIESVKRKAERKVTGS